MGGLAPTWWLPPVAQTLAHCLQASGSHLLRLVLRGDATRVHSSATACRLKAASAEPADRVFLFLVQGLQGLQGFAACAALTLPSSQCSLLGLPRLQLAHRGLSCVRLLLLPHCWWASCRAACPRNLLVWPLTHLPFMRRHDFNKCVLFQCCGELWMPIRCIWDLCRWWRTVAKAGLPSDHCYHHCMWGRWCACMHIMIRLWSADARQFLPTMSKTTLHAAGCCSCALQLSLQPNL